MTDKPESFTCPECGKTSYHPKDIEYGYCGKCRRFTGADLLEEDAWQECLQAERDHEQFKRNPL